MEKFVVGTVVFLASDKDRKNPMTVCRINDKPLPFPVFGIENEVNPSITVKWANSQGKIEVDSFPPEALFCE